MIESLFVVSRKIPGFASLPSFAIWIFAEGAREGEEVAFVSILGW